MENADAIIQQLGLTPHPEGGYYREVYRHSGEDGARGAATTIYFLLKAGEISRWHRIDAVEIWHYYAGAALGLRIAGDGLPPETVMLGTDLAAGERPVGVVPVGAWQSAQSTGAWTLVGCTVAPAFDFSGFEMALEGWEPDGFNSQNP